MKDRGKAVETEFPSDFNYSASDFPCKKHPSSSSVGICSQCLKERLIKLVCSDCGEQRLSSCSCSEISSNPKLSNVEIGSVGRISFLIENDQTDQTHKSSSSKSQIGERPEDFVLLKRSSSISVEGKRGNFWKFGRFFRNRKKENEIWGFDDAGVSRSRSLCSFRGGGGGYNDQDECSEYCFSSAKVSDFTGGLFLDSERDKGINGTEPRKSGPRGNLDSENSALFGTYRSVFPVKESDFSAMGDSGFIDLKLDLSSDSKAEYSVPKLSDLSDSDLGGLKSGAFWENQKGDGSFGNLMGDGVFSYGGSCRITVNERGIKKGKRGYKVWKWILKHHQGGWRSASKKDGNHMKV